MKSFEPIFANDGYRPNVGIIICNDRGKVFWARRVNRDGWQFPQGGVSRNETLLDAMYRELQEETGLTQQQVSIVAHTKKWLHYDLPSRYLRRANRTQNRKRTRFKGQKQVWFLLQLLEDDSVVDLQGGLVNPEFDRWRWVETDVALDNIVDFKRSVYQQALSELSKYLPTS
ncbi:RNA pyrophosphohydrolase [Arenicella sp.]|nr:RNA pyrophosphohydrolase [Arenicella sp.]